MPLIKDGRFVADDWVRPDPEGDLSGDATSAKLLLPFGVLREQGPALAEAGRTLGVEISNDTDPDALVPFLGRLQLICVQFPTSSNIAKTLYGSVECSGNGSLKESNWAIAAGSGKTRRLSRLAM
jgi:hypothetical protein